MRALAALLSLALLIVVGAFPWLAATLATVMVLALSGAVTLLAQPPILIAALAVLVAVSTRRRPA